MVDTINDTAGTEEHTAKDQLLHRVGIGPGGVEDGDAQLGHANDGDVVRAGTTSRDGTDTDINLGLLQLVRAEEDGVRVEGIPLRRLDFVLFLGELLQTLHCTARRTFTAIFHCKGTKNNAKYEGGE